MQQGGGRVLGGRALQGLWSLIDRDRDRRMRISIAADAGTDAVLDLTGCRMYMLRGPARTRSASVWPHSAQASKAVSMACGCWWPLI